MERPQLPVIKRGIRRTNGSKYGVGFALPQTSRCASARRKTQRDAFSRQVDDLCAFRLDARRDVENPVVLDQNVADKSVLSCAVVDQPVSQQRFHAISPFFIPVTWYHKRRGREAGCPTAMLDIIDARFANAYTIFK
ncbi:MAG: hypothetical protein R2912_09225 [Eubacteriales bacterium]